MIRELTTHKVNGLNENLVVLATDEPGSGNACHRYCVTAANSVGVTREVRCDVTFQEGPILEAGVNGISNESLLAIVEDRLHFFQTGPFACRENAIALTKIQEAMMWLHKRTRDRMARGVEGTMEK